MNRLSRSKQTLSWIFASAACVATAQAQPFHWQNIKLASPTGAARQSFKPFTARDVVTSAPMSAQTITLHDGRVVSLQSYLAELNQIERELNSFGSTLRTQEADLGVVAVSTAAQPVLTKQLPSSGEQKNVRWSHQLSHEVASVHSSGLIQERDIAADDESGTRFDRTTTHALSGRFLDSQTASLAQLSQRVVRAEDGSEAKETTVYINGRQVFRRGQIDDREARIWNSAFDIPLKSITIPVGPGSVEGKIGVRGQVNLDFEMKPAQSNQPAPQVVLNFKPHILADGYLSAATSPTNVGDAGLEGALTLAKNTLDINGSAGLGRGFKIEVKEATVDNLFEGFNGRIFGYANVTLPGKSADDKKKRFEKEFYAWDGIKIEQRIFEYKAPAPQPPTP